MTTADKYLRRTVVETLIGFAHNSMGNYTLVSVNEQSDYTRVDFELFHSMRGINGDKAKRVSIIIGTEDIND